MRVALVVDYSTSADAPAGQAPPGSVDTVCAVVSASNATGLAVLDAYGSLRQEKRLICAINGYPAGECAAAVEQPDPEPKPELEPETTPTVRVATTASRTKLNVNIDPDLRGKNAWTVHVLKKRQAKGGFTTVRTVRTKGPHERIVLDVPRGRYNVRVPAQRQHEATASRVVFIRR